MSKIADFYTEVFDKIISAEVSYDASFTDGRYEMKNRSDLCRMSAYAHMKAANEMLLEALGLKEVFEDYKNSKNET